MATNSLHAKVKWYNFIVFAAFSLPFLLFGIYLLFEIGLGLLQGKPAPGIGICAFIALTLSAGVYFTLALLRQLMFLTITDDSITQRGLLVSKKINVSEITELKLNDCTYVKAFGLASAVSCATIIAPECEITFMYDNYRNPDEIKSKLEELVPAKPSRSKKKSKTEIR